MFIHSFLLPACSSLTSFMGRFCGQGWVPGSTLTPPYPIPKLCPGGSSPGCKHERRTSAVFVFSAPAPGECGSLPQKPQSWEALG